MFISSLHVQQLDGVDGVDGVAQLVADPFPFPNSTNDSDTHTISEQSDTMAKSLLVVWTNLGKSGSNEFENIN